MEHNEQNPTTPQEETASFGYNDLPNPYTYPSTGINWDEQQIALSILPALIRDAKPDASIHDVCALSVTYARELRATLARCEPVTTPVDKEAVKQWRNELIDYIFFPRVYKRGSIASILDRVIAVKPEPTSNQNNGEAAK